MTSSKRSLSLRFAATQCEVNFLHSPDYYSFILFMGLILELATVLDKIRTTTLLPACSKCKNELGHSCGIKFHASQSRW